MNQKYFTGNALKSFGFGVCILVMGWSDINKTDILVLYEGRTSTLNYLSIKEFLLFFCLNLYYSCFYVFMCFIFAE